MLRVAIVGCGNIFTMHATSVVNLPDVTIVGVCDVKKERADLQAEKYHTTPYYDYKEMLSREKPDVVHICLPHYLHSIVSEYALNNGINVLCEKPMALNYEDACRLVDLAAEKKLKYGVIFQCRYNDSSKRVKEVIKSGRLGKILGARVVLTWNRSDEYYSLSDWKGTWDKEGGGLVINQMIHSLDIANWFIDSDIVEVQSDLKNRAHKNIEVEDTAEGIVRYANGAVLMFYGSNNYCCDEPIEIRLFCQNGKVVMQYEKAKITFNNGEEILVCQQENDIHYEKKKDYWGDQHISQIENFYNSVRNNVEPEISGREALKTQKLICEIYGKSGYKK